MKRLLLAQGDDFTARQMCREFQDEGYEVTFIERVKQLSCAAELIAHDLVISELRLEDGPTLAALRRIRKQTSGVVVVVTAYDSIASAAACRALGVKGYWVKPVTTAELIKSEFVPPSEVAPFPETPMSLNRAMWEYLHQVVETTGSLSQAARALGLDRRSLRRMIGKYAP